MFKKKIAGLLAAMMCVSLMGCGSGGEKAAGETKKAETEESSGSSSDSDVIKMAVGADRVDFSEDWRMSLKSRIRERKWRSLRSSMVLICIRRSQ